MPGPVLVQVLAAPGGLDERFPLVPGDLRVDQDRPVRAVRQQFQDRQQQARLHPPQQFRAGAGGRAPVLPVIEVPVRDQQPVLLQARVQLPGQGLLPAALRGRRAHRGQHRRVRPALADRHHPDLRERALAIPAGPGRAEGSPVLAGVRDVPLHPVHRHQPPRPQERPDRVQVRNRHGDLAEHLRHRLRPEPLPGLGDPARRRIPHLLPGSPAPQRLRQPGSDLLVIIVSEQGQRHHEIHHHVRRQLPPGPPRALPGRRDRVIDHIPRHRRRQHPQRDPVRQGTAASHNTSLRHDPRSCPGPPPGSTGTGRNHDQNKLNGIVAPRALRGVV